MDTARLGEANFGGLAAAAFLQGSVSPALNAQSR